MARVNAVSLNAPNQDSPAALSPAALSKGVALTQGPTAGGGFIDLISLLLGTVSTDSEPSAATPASSSDALSVNDVVFPNGDMPANPLGSPQLVPYKIVPYKGQYTGTSASLTSAPSPSVTSATPDQIATALIRFMAKGGAPGTPSLSPQTDATRKGSSDQKSARMAKTPSLPLFPANPNPIALATPQPGVVTVDPPLAAKPISMSSPAAPETGIIRGPVISGPVIGPAIGGPIFNGTAINSPVTDKTTTSGGAGLASQVLSFPDASAPDLKLTGPPPAITAPVAFKMQLTPVTSQEIPDPQTAFDPHPVLVPQSSATTEIAPEAGPAIGTPSPAPSTSGPVASSVFAPFSAAVSPEVFKDTASGTGSNLDDPGQGTPGVASKTTGEVTATDQTKQGSGQKSSTDAKSDAEPSSPQNPQEKSPVATDPSAPAANQIQATIFPTLHTPVPPQAALSHAAGAPPKSVDQPAALPVAEAKDAIAAPPLSSGQTQQIDVRISQPQTPPVDLQVAQKAGQIQVVVRTSDAGLETALRQDLRTLVHSLERSGFQAETFIPSAAEPSHTNSHPGSQDKQPDSSSSNGSFGQGRGQNQGRNGGRGSGGNSRGNASRDPQFEAWTNPQDQQQEQQL